MHTKIIFLKLTDSGDIFPSLTLGITHRKIKGRRNQRSVLTAGSV